jgi:hypothetical protein
MYIKTITGRKVCEKKSVQIINGINDKLLQLFRDVFAPVAPRRTEMLTWR